MTYSIIIPTYNEASNITTCLHNTRACLPNAELIVVDGGSTDQTVPLAQAAHADKVLSSPLGRGIQCRQGAEVAQGDIFIFLHADSILYRGTEAMLSKLFVQPQLQVATFAILFDNPHPYYRFFEWAAKRETPITTYGDQGIIVSRHFHENSVAMPKRRLLEDVAFFDRARRFTAIKKLQIPLRTSARRYEKNGFWKMNLLNGFFFIAYLLDLDDQWLHDIYYPK